MPPGNKECEMNITKEQMLLDMERVRRNVPYDVWFAIVCLIESSGENASDKRGPAKCPVCEGTGWNPTEPPPGATNPTSVPCHSCKGAGWILPYGPFCFGETTPAPSPGPSSSIEGYPASVKQALTVPAPLLAAKLSSYLEKKHE